MLIIIETCRYNNYKIQGVEYQEMSTEADKKVRNTHNFIALAVIGMALGVLVSGSYILIRVLDKTTNIGLIITIIIFGSFITWAGGMYDRVTNYKILDGFEKHGLNIMKYPEDKRMLATSAVISSTFFTVVFMIAAFITVISNSDVLNSVLSF